MIAALWMNPLVRKIAIYAAVGLAILYAARLWGNRQWQKGADAGRVYATEQAEKAFQKREAELKADIQAKTAALAESRASVVQEQRELAKLRASLTAGLDKTLAEIRAGKEATNAAVINVPADRLDDALRTLSAELAGTGPAH